MIFVRGVDLGLFSPADVAGYICYPVLGAGFFFPEVVPW